MFRALLVEDAHDVQFAVEMVLKPVCSVTLCETIAGARILIAQERFDILILDMALPDGDGIEFFAELQNSTTGADKIPTVFLTARHEVSDKIKAFNLGAEDYLVKPFHPGELRARVQARLTRQSETAAGKSLLSTSVGNIHLNVRNQRVVLTEGLIQSNIDLTPLEFRLLQYFVEHEDEPLSREDLIYNVWGKSPAIVDRVVDTHVSHLRKKISKCTHTVIPVHGMGYRFSWRPTMSPRESKKG